MKSTLFSLLTIFGFAMVNAQACPEIDAGPDQLIPCTASSTTLNATLLDVGETTTYNVNSIPHAPPIAYNAPGGTPVSVNIDDVWSGVINLSFPFCFFGQTYTQCLIGSNGAISFNLANAGGYHPWPFSASVPNPGLSQGGDIFGPYHDIDPSVAGAVTYYTLGQAPCRTLVISYNNLAHYDCTNLRSTHMIVLYETTNIIEVYVNNKSTCNSWNSGNTVIGIQNPAGTVGYTPPGRNTGNWTVYSPEAWQFLPSGAPIYSNIEWFDGPTLLGTGNSISVNPVNPSTTYTARTVYTRCDGLQIPVEDDVLVNFDGVSVDVSPSNIFTCSGATTTLTATSPTATNYTWSPGGITGASVDVSPSSTTTYTVTATNVNNGCSETATATVNIAQPSNTACNVLYVSPAGSPSGNGTKANPYDLETALEEGACNGTVVKMALGDYFTDTAITKVTSYITLEGGFDPAVNWDKVSTAGGTRIFRTATQTTSLVQGSGIVNEAGANPEVVAIEINNQDGFRFQDITISSSNLGGSSTYSGYQGVDVIGIRMNNCSDYNLVRTQVIPGSASNGADQIFSIPATNGGNSFGLQILNNGANTNVINSFVQAGAAGLGGAGGGANGTASNVSLTGTPLVASDVAFSLTGQPVISMQDIACTATNINFSASFSDNWSFDVGSTPPNATGSSVFSQYSNLGRKNIVYGPNIYTGFANIILDSQVNPSISTNAPFVNGAYRICAGESVNFSASNGGVGYIYNWTMGGGAVPNTYNGSGFENLTNITFNTSGTYPITLSYETNCCGVSSTDTLLLVVEEQPVVVMPNDTAYCLGALGGVSLTVSGGATGGSIMWSPSSGLSNTSSYTVVALPSTTTTYTAMLLDSSSLCSDTGTVTVTVNSLTLNSITTPATCAVNGSASVNVSGGSGSYDYVWSTGDLTQTISVTQPGQVDVLVTDLVTGCTETESVIVPSGPGALVGTLDITNVACSGDSSGTVILSAAGGTPPYTFDWTSLGIVSTSLNTADTISDLTAGTYDVILTDASSCEFTTTFTITEPNPLVFSVDTVANPSCAENGDGLIEVRADGGVRPYTYSWSGGVPVNVVNDMVVANGLFNGSYVLTIVDSVGCTDSISFNLFTAAIVSAFDTVLCFGESITVNGNVYNTTVVGAVEVIPNIGPNSCDSTVTFNVTVLDLIVENIDTTICQGQSLLVNGVSYNTSGTYADTIQYSGSACDSVQYVINLMVDSFVVENIDTTICQGDILTVNGVDYNSTGLYADTAFYVNSGCDSIQYVIDLTVDSFFVENIDTTICQGESLTVNGVVYTATGSYTDVITYSASGCDSLQFFIDLQIDSFVLENIDTTICQGQSLTVNGVTYNTAGSYVDTAFYSQSGCDSVRYAINLQIDSFVVETIDTTICQGQSLLVNGVSYTASGLFNDTAFYAASGCDSIQYVIDLQIDSFVVENIDTVLCFGESIVVNGVQYDATGFYQDTLFYPSGCDQIQYNIDLEVLDEKLGLIDTAICDGESIVVNGTAYSATTAGAQEVFVVGPYGCDSTVTINLQVNDLPALNASANPDSINIGVSTELVAVGNGDFVWESIQNDSIYVVTPSETSTYTVELTDANGCVTQVSVTVYVLGASEEEIKIPDAFTPNGDGINDVFRMVTGQTLGEVELIIYNRWGDNLFQQTGDSGIAWDGTYQGQEQANDVYIYLFRVKTLDDKEFFFQGEVTLYR